MKRNSPPLTSAALGIRFSRRALLVGGAQGAVGLLLAGRMTYLSVAENERYEMLSESNRVNLTLVPPRRGWIVDRNGKPLANNRADFRVDIIPDRVVDIDYTLTELRRLLLLDPSDIADIRKKLKTAGGFQPVEVASGLTWDQFAAISVRLPDLPGVAPQRGFSRQYPTGAAVGHLLGYVGAASAEDYEKERTPLLVTPGFKIGKDGLERYFEQVLRGEPGAKRVEVSARGKIVRELEERADTPGKPVHLTIDAELQHYAARRIGPESGSVVVMDCQTGDILAMASMPSFDPNSFSDGIGSLEYKWLTQDDHVPLRNKTLKGLYPPGSTVKPMVALALLESGVKPEETQICTGRADIAGGKFHCHARRGHGSVNMASAIYKSCDIYFYKMALRVGMDPIALMARRLALGEEFDLPVASQSYGTVPDPAWKLKKYKQKWEAYDTVNATIGQGYMLSNPLQLAVHAARIASGRKVMPRLLLSKDKTPAPLFDVPPEHWEFVRKAMRDTVSPIGTAGRARLPLDGIEMGGKTGTAQVRRITMAERARGVRSNSSLNFKLRDHGLFVCFAPVDNPRYACAVVVEHGGGSGAAYPIARDVLTYAFDKAKGMAALEGAEAGWGGTIEQRMARSFAAFKARNGVASVAPEPSPSPSDGASPTPTPTPKSSTTPAAQPSPAATPVTAPSASPAAPPPNAPNGTGGQP